MQIGSDFDTLTPKQDYWNYNKMSQLLLDCSLDPFSFDEEATKATILARFVDSTFAEKKFAKLAIKKHIDPSILRTIFNETVEAFISQANDNANVRKTTIALMKLLIFEVGPTRGLASCLISGGGGGNGYIVELLVNGFGADPKIQVSAADGTDSLYLLSLVCESRNVAVVKAMVENGTMVNQKNSADNNELMRLVKERGKCPCSTKQREKVELENDLEAAFEDKTELKTCSVESAAKNQSRNKKKKRGKKKSVDKL